MSDEPKKTVYQCIADVQYSLAKAGISKAQKNEQQHYNFRGIDDVYNALSSLLASTGLVIIPSYTERTVTERATKSGTIMFDVVVKGDYTLISTHDGSFVNAGPFWGEAMDTGDKATNKAMSASYKYMAIQVFAIPTAGDNDADKTTPPETVVITAREGARELLSPEEMAQVDTFAGLVFDALNDNNPQLAFENYKGAYRELQLRASAHAQAAFTDKFSAPQRTQFKKMRKAELDQKRAEQIESLRSSALLGQQG